MEEYKIIVPYDFQELSGAALKQAYDLARFVKTGILLVSVINDTDLILLSDLFRGERSEAVMNDITSRLQDIADKASAESGVPVSFRIENGKIYERILEVSRESNARFIVMGRSSKASPLIPFIGSNTMRVIEKSVCPVITMPSEQCITGFKHIVLPIDLTKQTREEVFNAISFGLFFDATIHLVSVVMGGIAERKSRIYRKMQRMKRLIEENGVTCTDKLFKRKPMPIHEIILEYAQSIKADAVMIMTHQEISTSDKYIGAVAHLLINDAEMPVISLTSAASANQQKVWFNLFNIFKKK